MEMNKFNNVPIIKEKGITESMAKHCWKLSFVESLKYSGSLKHIAKALIKRDLADWVDRNKGIIEIADQGSLIASIYEKFFNADGSKK